MQKAQVKCGQYFHLQTAEYSGSESKLMGHKVACVVWMIGNCGAARSAPITHAGSSAAEKLLRERRFILQYPIITLQSVSCWSERPSVTLAMLLGSSFLGYLSSQVIVTVETNLWAIRSTVTATWQTFSISL